MRKPDERVFSEKEGGGFLAKSDINILEISNLNSLSTIVHKHCSFFVYFYTYQTLDLKENIAIYLLQQMRIKGKF